jgi:hypothetical protein
MTKCSTNSFYHGGHLGDLIYSLYSIKKYGGGHLYIGPHQHTNWTPKLMHTAAILCAHQNYIDGVDIVNEKPLDLTYDFTDSWGHQEVKHHFEYNGKSIASCSLKKRDFINLNKYKYKFVELLGMLNQYETWLTAPNTCSYDIVCHLPHHKLVRDKSEWHRVFDYFSTDFKIAIIGADDIDYWQANQSYTIIKPDNLLEAADYINSAKLFIGVASCNYVIAEGLGKFRFVESKEASGVDPMNDTGYQIAKWDTDRVIESMHLVLRT